MLSIAGSMLLPEMVSSTKVIFGKRQCLLVNINYLNSLFLLIVTIFKLMVRQKMLCHLKICVASGRPLDGTFRRLTVIIWKVLSTLLPWDAPLLTGQALLLLTLFRVRV